MAKNNNLTDFLANTAQAINTAAGTTGGIDAQDFESRIEALKLSTQTADATATASHIVEGDVAYVKGVKVTGTMTDHGSVIMSLGAGGSYTIPAGYHDGGGKITTKNLSSQTSGTATASDILASKTAWVDGSKVTGTMVNQGAKTATLDTTTKSYTIPAGYHDGSGKVSITLEDDKTVEPSTNSQTITSASGKVLSKVTVKAIPAVDRANTTISSTTDANKTKIILTASNNQGTGYVTGADKTDTKEVTLSQSGATVTATDGTSSISTTISSGAYSVSHSLTSGAGSVSASSDNVVLGTKTTTKPTSGHYITTQGSGSVSATGTATISSAGYISVGSKTSTSSSKSSNTATAYYPVQEGAHSAGISLSAGSGSVSTTSDNVSLTVASSKPSSGYYITSTGSGSVSATATSSIDTEGYLETGSKTANGSKSSNTATKYYTIPAAALSASGTASATTTVAPGTVSIANKSASVSGKTQITAAPTTSTSGISTYYMAVDATAAANTTGTTSNISGTATAGVSTAGYAPTSLTGSGSVSGTATAKTSAKTSSTYYIPVASGSCTVSGGGLSVTNNYSGTPTVDITLDGQTTSGVGITDTKPSSGYYLTLGASSTALSGTTKVTRAAITDQHTAGYIPTKSAATVISSTTASPTVTVNEGTKTEYVTIPTGSCAVSGGDLSGGSAVTPTVTLSSGSDTNMTNITTGTKDTTNYPYYFKVSGASSSESSTVTRDNIYDTHTAGYIPAKSKSTVISGASKTVTVNAGSGSTYVGIKKASGSLGGSASSGAASAAINNVNTMRTITSTSGKTAGTDYFTVKATAIGTAGSYTPSYTVTTAGYLKDSVTGSAKTVSVTSDTTGKSIHIPKANFTISGASVKTTSTGGGYVKDNTVVATIDEASYSGPTATEVNSDDVLTTVFNVSETGLISNDTYTNQNTELLKDHVCKDARTEIDTQTELIAAIRAELEEKAADNTSTEYDDLILNVSYPMSPTQETVFRWNRCTGASSYMFYAEIAGNTKILAQNLTSTSFMLTPDIRTELYTFINLYRTSLCGSPDNHIGFYVKANTGKIAHVVAQVTLVTTGGALAHPPLTTPIITNNGNNTVTIEKRSGVSVYYLVKSLLGDVIKTGIMTASATEVTFDVAVLNTVYAWYYQPNYIHSGASSLKMKIEGAGGGSGGGPLNGGIGGGGDGEIGQM